MSPPLFANFLQTGTICIAREPDIITDKILTDLPPSLPPSLPPCSLQASQYLYDQDLFDTSDLVPCPWWPTYLNLKSSVGKNFKTSWVAETNIRWLLWSSELSWCCVRPGRQWLHQARSCEVMWGQLSLNKSNDRADWKYWVQCCCYSSQISEAWEVTVSGGGCWDLRVVTRPTPGQHPARHRRRPAFLLGELEKI